MEEERQRRPAMVRISTRIRLDQQKYIKAISKIENLTEGEVFRKIIDKDININNF